LKHQSCISAPQGPSQNPKNIEGSCICRSELIQGGLPAQKFDIQNKQSNVFKTESGRRVYSMLASIYIGFDDREKAILQSPLSNLIYYHLELTFMCLYTTGTTEEDDVIDIQTGHK
jgi:hypothetical protein